MFLLKNSHKFGDSVIVRYFLFSNELTATKVHQNDFCEKTTQSSRLPPSKKMCIGASVHLKQTTASTHLKWSRPVASKVKTIEQQHL